MTTQKLFTLASLSLCTLMMSACVADQDLDTDTPRGALLYDLDEAELEHIHATYVADEDIEMTRARLTAPFDCSLYGQFCEQVGRDAAYEITGEMVDLALDGATPEAIEAQLDARIDEAVALGDEAQVEDEFRAAGGWVTQTNGNYRMRVRNGITTPLFGDRRAWTEAQTQKKSLGIWSNKPASQLCVNSGTNTQTYGVKLSPSSYPQYDDIESINLPNACGSSIKTKTVSSYHGRHTSGSADGAVWWYTIRANGCSSAQINGLYFNACAPEFSEGF